MINIKQITHNVFFWVLHLIWILHNSAKRMISVAVCICLLKTINSKTPCVMKPNSISFFLQSKMFIHNFWNIFVIFWRPFLLWPALSWIPVIFYFWVYLLLIISQKVLVKHDLLLFFQHRKFRLSGSINLTITAFRIKATDVFAKDAAAHLLAGQK